MNNLDRRKAREIAMHVLFQWEAQGLIERKNASLPAIADSTIAHQALEYYLESFYPKNKSLLNTDYAGRLVEGALRALDTIDTIIDSASSNWKLSRMDAIDRAILRVACFELAIEKAVSAPIIINEAVEIGKKYGGENSHSFINGILDTIKEKAL